MRFVEIQASGCWLWRGGTDGEGYGHFWLNGRTTRATAAAMELLRGLKRAPSMLVLHRCDNPPCVNPDHLFFGSQRDNIQDCLAKGRRDAVRPPVRRGEANNKAKLTEIDVLSIRSAFGMPGITQKALALRYGVSIGGIKAITQRRTWRWL